MRRARWLTILGHAPFAVLCCPSCFVPICICSATFHVERDDEVSRKYGNTTEEKNLVLSSTRFGIKAEEGLTSGESRNL